LAFVYFHILTVYPSKMTEKLRNIANLSGMGHSN
jgi:hypothetical protein